MSTPVLEPASSALVCGVGGRLCAIPIQFVEETMRPLPLVALAGMPPFVRGIAVIRGLPTPVVDLGGLLGLDDASPGRFVTVRAGERTVALAVARVVGVRDVAHLAASPLPPLLGETPAQWVEAVAALDAELLFVLAGSQWVPEPVWAAVAGGAP